MAVDRRFTWSSDAVSTLSTQGFPRREDIDKEHLQVRLVVSLMHGGSFCVVFGSLQKVDFGGMFDETHFSEVVLDR